MKPAFKPLLFLTDLHSELDPQLVILAARVCRLRRQRARNGRVFHTWHAVAARYLMRVFPRGWVYQGGRHIAMHASPPSHDPRDKDREAGPCLFRIIEINSPREAVAEGITDHE